MFCPHCGRSNEDNYTYCLSCGARLDNFPTVVQGKPINKRQQLLIGSGVVAVIALIVLGGIAIYFYQRIIELERKVRVSPSPTVMQTPPQTQTQLPTSAPTPSPVQIKPRPTVTPGEQPIIEQPPPLSTQNTIVDSTFPVGAQQYRYYLFTVTGNRIGNLKGTFTATGGRNDIDVWIIDENQMANFSNGHNTYFYYHSNYVSYGEINLRLRPGSYYVIFSNKAALLTNKVVSAQIYLN
jgi:zinc-ribbon domain